MRRSLSSLLFAAAAAVATASAQSRRVRGIVPAALGGTRQTASPQACAIIEARASRIARTHLHTGAAFRSAINQAEKLPAVSAAGSFLWPVAARSALNAQRIIIAILLFGAAIIATAQTQTETRFEYDGAGNIVRVITETNDAPPTLSALVPAFVHQSESVFVTALGNNLVRASVTTTRPDLIIQDVIATKFSVRFRVIAPVNASIGPANLTFTTRLGSTVAVFTVAARTPVITTLPIPIVLAPDGVHVPVRLVFEQAFTTDQTFDIAIQDTGIASVDSTSVVLLAGDTVATVNAAGLAAGSTNLEVNQLSNSLALAIPVVVLDAQLPNATNLFFAQPVGVSVFTAPPPYTGTGVFQTSKPLGAAYGVSVTQTTPSVVSAGTSTTLIVEGVELDQVTAIGFDLSDGITITRAFVVNPEGTELQIPIAVGISAARNQRVIVFTTPGGASVFSGGVFQIVN